MKEFAEVGGMRIVEGLWKYLEKTCLNATLFIINPA
jgi:hypothetical protein